MSERRSYSQQVFPDTFEFTSVLGALVEDGLKIMFAAVWSGLDSFRASVLEKNLPPSRDNLDLERDLTEMVYPHILQAIPEGAPYYLHHEKKERETAVPGKQPPEPDLSFVSLKNIRVTLPLDAKVIDDDVANLTDYVDTFNGRFLSCVYAPFSKEGAMLTYLLAGNAANLFLRIAAALPCTMSDRPFITERNHYTSEHTRTSERCRYRPFRCHHLVFRCG
jgi:hypothetical protein